MSADINIFNYISQYFQLRFPVYTAFLDGVTEAVALFENKFSISLN